MSDPNQIHEPNWEATFLLALQLGGEADYIGAPDRNAVGTNLLRFLIQRHLLIDGIEAELCSAGYFNNSFYLVTVADPSALGAAMAQAKGIAEQIAPGKIWLARMNGTSFAEFQADDALGLRQCVDAALAAQREIAAMTDHLLASLKREMKRLCEERDRVANEGEDWKRSE